MTPIPSLAVLLADPPLDPPLDPSGDEGRRLLRRELVRPEYYDKNVLQRIVEWLQRRTDHAVDGARHTPSLSWFLGTLIALALVVGIALLLSRARLTTRQRTARQPVLVEEHVTSTQLRERAHAALAEGRFEDAVLDGFRALAMAQVERGRLDDLPDATAHEVALVLGREFPAQRSRTTEAAALFDAVLYGDRAATADQARSVLGLDTELVHAR